MTGLDAGHLPFDERFGPFGYLRVVVERAIFRRLSAVFSAPKKLTSMNGVPNSFSSWLATQCIEPVHCTRLRHAPGACFRAATVESPVKATLISMPISREVPLDKPFLAAEVVLAEEVEFPRLFDSLAVFWRDQFHQGLGGRTVPDHLVAGDEAARLDRDHIGSVPCARPLCRPQ